MPVNKSLAKWLHLHFDNQNFNGRHFVFTRNANGVFKKLYSADADKFVQWASELSFRDDWDYYITANSTCGLERKSSDLFSLNNIVIDVDLHIDMHPHERDLLINSFLWRFNRDLDIPSPTSIVLTGRGIQFWWAIVPCHSSCLFYYNQAKEFLLNSISELIYEYSEFESFQLDRTASMNAIGLYRIPFSKNTKSNSSVRLINDPLCPKYTIQFLVLLASSLSDGSTSNCDDHNKPPDLLVGKYSREELRIFKGFSQAGFFRAQQLIKLRSLRDDYVGSETRNNLSFMFYNAVKPGLSHEEAFDRLCLFNAGFKQPLSLCDLEGVISTAKELGGYKYTNRRMIEFLGITKREQSLIGLSETRGPKNSTDHPSRTSAAKLIKDDRNAKVNNLHAKGLSKSSIAKKLGISPITVSKILSYYNSESKKDKIIRLFNSGISNKDIALQCHCSTKTVQRTIASIKVT